MRRALGASADCNELTDAIYALKETSRLLDDVRKETDKTLDLFERLDCLAWMATAGDPIRTEYCTGSPDVKQTARIPRPGTAEYEALCEYFKVDPNVPYRPHWPSMLEELTETQRQGLPLPPGIDPSETISVFKVGVRKRRPILDEDDDGAALQHDEVLRCCARLADAVEQGDQELIKRRHADLEEAIKESQR